MFAWILRSLVLMIVTRAITGWFSSREKQKPSSRDTDKRDGRNDSAYANG